MTLDYIIDKLSSELTNKTGSCEHITAYREIIQRAVSIGIDYFKSCVVVAYDMQGIEVGMFKNAYNAAIKLNADPGAVCRVLKGKQHSTKGYVFKYLPRKYYKIH